MVACAIVRQETVAGLLTLNQGELSTSTEWAGGLEAGSWEAYRCVTKQNTFLNSKQEVR